MQLNRNRLGAMTLLVAAGLSAPSMIGAQTTPSDVRLIRPDIMVLLDTSGSMEFRTNMPNNACGGATGGACNRCSNGASMCSPLCPASESRNRWTTAIEVLTGTIEDFHCTESDRTTSAFNYDYLYAYSHHQPLSGVFPLHDSRAVQRGDGILDVYYDRVRFGLMTFDNNTGVGTEANDGMFSYADTRTYRPNMCATSFFVNLGAKRASVDGNIADIVPGGLISVGPPAADSAALGLINRQVQETVTGRPAGPGPVSEMPGVRPFGTTPIAAFLEDALHYWLNHPDVADGSSGGAGDPYFNCRTRANILITDGAPTDFRPSCAIGDGVCPYQPASETAMTMAMAGSGLPAVKTYVLAFNGSDPEAVAALEPIAVGGNTSRVYYANDRPTFAAALSTIIDTISSQTSTRTPPVFGEAGTTSASGTSQYQFNASFNVVPGQPWAGSLVRTRTVCQAPSGGGAPVPTQVDADASAGDDFAYSLRRAVRDGNGWGPRYLWTYLPTGATTTAHMRATIESGMSVSVGAPTELTASMAPALFNYTTSSEVTDLLAWLRGDAGTVRENRPLGDIFRSTPSFVPPPRVNLPDQTFLAYRQRTLPITGRRRTAVTVGTREPMIYVGSNDGVLHAFNADTGEEAWGFVPPYLVPNLRSGYPTTRTQGVDGTPVVKEVYYQRSTSSLTDDTSWHTVLVVGLRLGRGAYIGMDVTDPYNPRFLWQFTDPDIEITSGTPAIGTVYYSQSGGAPEEHAVAFLPGGAGELSTAPCSPTAAPRAARPNTLMTGWTGGRGARRPYVRCWNSNQGRFFYVVDLQTGALIRKIGAAPSAVPYDPSMSATTSPPPTHSPLVGAPALYNGLAGVVTTRAYVGDADGSLWRVDFSSTNPANWWMSDIFDLFWDRGHNSGQPIIERPVTSIDEVGRTIIAFGSGDTDLLEGSDENRVASIVETTQTDAAGTSTGIAIEENWEIRPGMQTADRDFLAGERLTGSMTLFNNVLYFGTFAPQVGTDPCQSGAARLWGVDLTRNDPTGSIYPQGRLDRDGDASTTADVVRVTRDLNNNGTEADDANSLLFGVAVARRPNCNVSASVIDPTTGLPRTFVSSTTGGEYRLVLQIAQSGMAGGTTTATFTRSLPAPIVPSRVDSIATVFE